MANILIQPLFFCGTALLRAPSNLFLKVYRCLSRWKIVCDKERKKFGYNHEKYLRKYEKQGIVIKFIHHHFLYKLTLFANFDTLRKPYPRYGFSKEPILHGKRAYIATQNRLFCNIKPQVSFFTCGFLDKSKRFYIPIRSIIWGQNIYYLSYV